MSDTTDDMEAGASLLELYNECDEWVCRDGSVIRFKDMDDNHLMNSFKLVVRNCNLVPATMIDELTKRDLI